MPLPRRAGCTATLRLADVTLWKLSAVTVDPNEVVVGHDMSIMALAHANMTLTSPPRGAAVHT